VTTCGSSFRAAGACPRPAGAVRRQHRSVGIQARHRVGARPGTAGGGRSGSAGRCRSTANIVLAAGATSRARLAPSTAGRRRADRAWSHGVGHGPSAGSRAGVCRRRRRRGGAQPTALRARPRLSPVRGLGGPPARTWRPAVAAHRVVAARRPHDLVLVGLQHRVFRPVAVPSLPTVRQLGYVDETSLRALLTGATALLYPSRYEGFGAARRWRLGAAGRRLSCPTCRPSGRRPSGERPIPATRRPSGAWADAIDAALAGSVPVPEPDPWEVGAGRQAAARGGRLNGSVRSGRAAGPALGTVRRKKPDVQPQRPVRM